MWTSLCTLPASCWEIRPLQPSVSWCCWSSDHCLFTEAWGGPRTAGRRGRARGDSTAEDIPWPPGDLAFELPGDSPGLGDRWEERLLAKQGHSQKEGTSSHPSEENSWRDAGKVKDTAVPLGHPSPQAPCLIKLRFLKLFFGEDPHAGKNWGQEEKGATKDGWMASQTRGTWVWANSETVKDRETWSATIHGVTKSQTWFSNWTTTIILIFFHLKNSSLYIHYENTVREN